MDWEFYGILFLILFGIVALLLSIRLVLSRRIDRYEAKRRVEEEARRVSETNSGL